MTVVKERPAACRTLALLPSLQQSATGAARSQVSNPQIHVLYSFNTNFRRACKIVVKSDSVTLCHRKTVFGFCLNIPILFQIGQNLQSLHVKTLVSL